MTMVFSRLVRVAALALALAFAPAAAQAFRHGRGHGVCSVPDVRGLVLSYGQNQLAISGCRTRVVSPPRSQRHLVIVAQRPGPNRRIRIDTRVVLSLGPKRRAPAGCSSRRFGVRASTPTALVWREVDGDPLNLNGGFWTDRLLGCVPPAGSVRTLSAAGSDQPGNQGAGLGLVQTAGTWAAFERSQSDQYESNDYIDAQDLAGAGSNEVIVGFRAAPGGLAPPPSVLPGFLSHFAVSGRGDLAILQRDGRGETLYLAGVAMKPTTLDRGSAISGIQFTSGGLTWTNAGTAHFVVVAG